jgi:hypothetical protein
VRPALSAATALSVAVTHSCLSTTSALRWMTVGQNHVLMHRAGQPCAQPIQSAAALRMAIQMIRVAINLIFGGITARPCSLPHHFGRFGRDSVVLLLAPSPLLAMSVDERRLLGQTVGSWCFSGDDAFLRRSRVFFSRHFARRRSPRTRWTAVPPCWFCVAVASLSPVSVRTSIAVGLRCA